MKHTVVGTISSVSSGSKAARTLGHKCIMKTATRKNSKILLKDRKVELNTWKTSLLGRMTQPHTLFQSCNAIPIKMHIINRNQTCWQKSTKIVKKPYTLSDSWGWHIKRQTHGGRRALSIQKVWPCRAWGEGGLFNTWCWDEWVVR